MTIAHVTGKYGTEMIATMFGSEITNPLLQFRWFLRETGNYKTILGEIVDHAFMFLFGFFRIGIGSYLLYTYFQQDTDFWGRLGGTVIYAISWMFWINIVLYAAKKYRKRFQNWQRKKFKSDADSSTYKNGTVANGDNHNSDTQNSHGVKELSNDALSKRPAKQCNGYTKKSQ
jgi:hypothetical protein